MLGHNTQAVRHQNKPQKVDLFWLAACQPSAGTVFPPLAGKYRASQRLANNASRRLASGFSLTNQLVGIYSGQNMVANRLDVVT